MFSVTRSLLLVSLAAPAVAQDINVMPFLGGYQRVTHITHAGDSTGRLFLVEQAGRIRIVRNGVPLAVPFLDIADRVSCCGERGLLSVAFPPQYSAKGHFYVYYTDRNGDITVARYFVTGNPDVADAARQDVVLTVPHRQYSNHNGGQLAFGPRDGYLYIGTGDGGGGGDPLRSGQDLNSLLGKLLRIDVESGARPYAIPADNPFANRAGTRPEIWAYGLRNPWRFSFDRETGDLWIGDVGQTAREEVNFQPAGSRGGDNYGWSVMEGKQCYQAGCNPPPGHLAPVIDYANPAEGCSVTGGFVYRGSRFPALRGLYIYGDYCSGRIWSLRRGGDGWINTLAPASRIPMTTFGEDDEGNLYLNNYNSGEILLVTGPQPPVVVSSVVSAASYQPGLSPGSIAALFGSGLTMAAGVLQAGRVPLPTELFGTSVTINGIRAPLYATASLRGGDQINFQVPYELAGVSRATVVVRVGSQASASLEVGVSPVQPGIFVLAGNETAAVNAADNQLISAANPATEGMITTFYGTGLGSVDNSPPTGSAAPTSPLARTIGAVEVRIGGRQAEVLFSGLAPGFAGLYQLNVRVPAGVSAGAQPLTVAVGGQPSNMALLAIR